MAKPLIFSFAKRDLAFGLKKVDRTKLYGYKETLVLDEDGDPCELATLASDGRTVTGKGSIAMGYLSPDGAWCERGTLTPIDVEGNEIPPAPSSFSAPVELVEQATIEDYLDHNIRALYSLDLLPDENASKASDTAAEKLLQELRDGVIYKFPYSFRGGVGVDQGFLLANEAGGVFLAIGKATQVEFVKLQQSSSLLEDEGDIDEDDGDLMDFDMI
ncbi:MAG: hypothetical protein MPJ50_01820 [Pirellulales bacterium]|nr:hypothetical protein [Pirellulales bacterium]